MWKSIPDLLQVLETELRFLDSGGYRDPETWRPQFIFLDSPTCIHPAGSEGGNACKDCLLMPFVPVALRHAAVPCHYIPLTADGLTVDSLQRCGTQQELEDTLRSWLESNIAKLRRAQAARTSAPARADGCMDEKTVSTQNTNCENRLPNSKIPPQMPNDRGIGDEALIQV